MEVRKGEGKIKVGKIEKKTGKRGRNGKKVKKKHFR